MQVATIIVNWNNLKDTRECLDSLTLIQYKNHKVFLVDNGSTDSSYEILSKEYPSVIHLRSKENLGFAGGNNLGIKEALRQGAEALILLNNDTVILNDIVDSFVAFHKQMPKAILGGRVYQYHDKEAIDHLGGIWNEEQLNFQLFAKNLRELPLTFDLPIELDYIVGCLMFIPRELFETIGLFDERFFLIWEESDLCFRAKKIGFKNFYIPDPMISHKGSQSFSGGSTHSAYYWYRNRLLWLKNHYSPFDYHQIFLTFFIPNWLKIAKNCFFETLQQIFSPTQEREKKRRRNLAILHGGIDHIRGKYGHGPAWISQKKRSSK